MYRRRLLAAIGVGSTAGCLGALNAGPDGDDTGGGTTESPQRVTTEDGYAVDVGTPDVQASILAGGTHFDVRYTEGSAFLRVPLTLTTADGEPVTELEPYDRLREGTTLNVGGGTVESAEFDRSHDGPGVRFALPVPVGAYDQGSVSVDVGSDQSVHHPLPPSVLAALAEPPAFAVRGLSVQSPIEGGSVVATVVVENVGGADGRFLTEFGPDTLSDTPEVAFEVPVGETVTEDVSVSAALPPETDEVTVRLEWGSDEVERTVEVAGD